MRPKQSQRIRGNRPPAAAALPPGCLVLLTGATGYVGGRLLPALQQAGCRVRCMARRPERLLPRVGARVEVVRADAVTGDGLADALQGVHSAYYLIHSMGSPRGFEEEDRRAAFNFANAARAAGVRRIIYLGALVDETTELSPHLRSRLEVGRILREAGIPVVELRASIVIGSGSLSFEMIRALVEHLPVLVTPRWVSVPAQPIGIEDLLAYLRAALEIEVQGDGVYEIGAADQLSYADLIREYARQRGLRRLIVRVPVLSPRLSALWLGLVTPVYARIGRKLVESIKNPTVVRNERARLAFDITPQPVSVAIARALDYEERGHPETRWSDSLSASGARSGAGDQEPVRPDLLDSRAVQVACPPAQAFRPIQRIGGRQGWYAFQALWTLRGLLDLLAGGVGMRRGRRHPDVLELGDVIDCWRVVGFEPDRRLLLAAEMKLPGRATLEFCVEPSAAGSRIRQTATFEASGLAGRAYWYGIYPLHALVFQRMISGIARRAVDPENKEDDREGSKPARPGSHPDEEGTPGQRRDGEDPAVRCSGNVVPDVRGSLLLR